MLPHGRKGEGTFRTKKPKSQRYGTVLYVVLHAVRVIRRTAHNPRRKTANNLATTIRTKKGVPGMYTDGCGAQRTRKSSLAHVPCSVGTPCLSVITLLVSRDSS